MYKHILLTLALSIIACADVEGSQTDADLRGSTTWQRRLTPEQAVPTGTPIGKSLAPIVREATAGLTAVALLPNQECRWTSFRNSAGQEVVLYMECTHSDELIIRDPESQAYLATYGDRSEKNEHGVETRAKDGLVDSVYQKEGEWTSLVDLNLDGKVDAMQVPFEGDPRFEAVACRAADQHDTRTLYDRDFDGRFEEELLNRTCSP